MHEIIIGLDLDELAFYVLHYPAIPTGRDSTG